MSDQIKGKMCAIVMWLGPIGTSVRIVGVTELY